MAELDKLISDLESRLAACGDAGWCTVSAEMLERVIDALRGRFPEYADWRHNGSEWRERWICTACGYYQIGERTRFCPGARAVPEAPVLTSSTFRSG